MGRRRFERPDGIDADQRDPAGTLLEDGDIPADGPQRAAVGAGLGRHDHLGVLLGQIDEYAGDSGGLSRLLAQPVGTGPRRCRLGRPLIAGPSGQRRKQLVETGLLPVHGPNGSVRSVPDDCLFCRIVAGVAPSTEVLSTETTYSFRDINPGAPVHVLVVPKEHIENAAAIEADHGEMLADLVITARRVAEQEHIAASGYRLVFNVGDDALNSVPHLHLHVIGGRRLGWPPG